MDCFSCRDQSRRGMIIYVHRTACKVLNKLGICPHFLVKISNMKFLENPDGSGTVPWGHTDEHDETVTAVRKRLKFVFSRLTVLTTVLCICLQLCP